MVDNNSDPFEAAATAARFELDDNHADALPEPSTEELLDDVQANDTVPARRRRGRPRSRRRSRARAPRRPAVASPAGESAAASEGSASQTTQTVVVPPLPPEKLIPVLRQLDKTFVRMLGTIPLDEQELRDGAEACAPALDHYAPLFLTQPWAGAALWAVLVYAPRIDDVIVRRKAGGARKGDTFREVSPATRNQSAAPEIVVD